MTFSAPLIVQLASSVVIFATLWIIIANRNSKRRRILFGTIGLIIYLGLSSAFFLLHYQAAIDRTPQIGVGVSAKEANQHLVLFKIPSKATDVNYRHNNWSSTAETASFSIDKQLFQDWVKKNNWHMTRFIVRHREKELQTNSTDDSTLADLDLSSETELTSKCFVDINYKVVDIENGYHAHTSTFKEGNLDYGQCVTYDLDNSRAYIWATTR